MASFQELKKAEEQASSLVDKARKGILLIEENIFRKN